MFSFHLSYENTKLSARRIPLSLHTNTTTLVRSPFPSPSRPCFALQTTATRLHRREPGLTNLDQRLQEGAPGLGPPVFLELGLLLRQV